MHSIRTGPHRLEKKHLFSAIWGVWSRVALVRCQYARASQRRDRRAQAIRSVRYGRLNLIAGSLKALSSGSSEERSYYLGNPPRSARLGLP